jgi:citrate synthase
LVSETVCLKMLKVNIPFSFSLPNYAAEFLEMILMVTADHGPAVSGAHNTIVCARAGKDLVSCLVSGLLTIVRENNEVVM